MRSLINLLHDFWRSALRHGVLKGSTVLLLSISAQANTFTHRDKNGVVTFSDAPIRNGQVIRTHYSSTIRTPVIANPCKGMTRASLEAKGQQLNTLFHGASVQHGVDANLLKAVARAESCFDAGAVSRAGAKGLMQLMPHTARDMGVSNIFDTEQNLAGGARYLAAMLQRYSDDLDLALAAYNAGPGNVDRYSGIPPFSETRRYIKSVKAFKARYERLQGTPTQAGNTRAEHTQAAIDRQQ